MYDEKKIEERILWLDERKTNCIPCDREELLLRRENNSPRHQQQTQNTPLQDNTVSYHPIPGFSKR